MHGSKSSDELVRRVDPLPSHAAWFLVGALSLASMVAYVDRQILVLLFGPIKQDLGLSDTEVSLLVGLAFVACYSVFGLLSGWLTDRYSRKGLVSIGVLFWSAATAACGAANSFTQLFAARMAVGVGESTLSPAAMSSLTDAFPREKLARAMSVYTAAAFVGMGLAMVLGGFGIGIATHLVEADLPFVGGLRPWQLTFILVGAVGAVAVIPLMFTREPNRSRPVQNSATTESANGPPFLGFLKANKGSFGLLWIGYSLNAMAGVATMSWTPTYFIRTFGLSATEIGLIYGLIITVFGLIGVLSGPAVLAWITRKGFRDGYVLFPLICLAFGAVPSVLAFSTDIMWLALLLISFKQLVMTLPMPIMAMSMQIIAPSELRGRLSAIYLFMGNILAAAIGPVTVAIFTDYVFADEARLGSSIIANTVLMVPLAAACLWLAIKPYRASLADADAGFVRSY